VQKDEAHCPDTLGQGCKDPKPLRPVRKCLVVQRTDNTKHRSVNCFNCVVHHQAQQTKQGTKYLLVS